jgi:transcriptional regulator with XRE-family HTH domain
MTVSNKKVDKTLLLISKKLKELRIEEGYTSYEKFAVENDIDRKQYWRIEKGANLTLQSLMKVLKIHKISLKDFFNLFEEDL